MLLIAFSLHAVHIVETDDEDQTLSMEWNGLFPSVSLNFSAALLLMLSHACLSLCLFRFFLFFKTFHYLHHLLFMFIDMCNIRTGTRILGAVHFEQNIFPYRLLKIHYHWSGHVYRSKCKSIRSTHLVEILKTGKLTVTRKKYIKAPLLSSLSFSTNSYSTLNIFQCFLSTYYVLSFWMLFCP